MEYKERKAEQGQNSEEAFSFREKSNGHERGSLGQEPESLEQDDTEIQEGFIPRGSGQQYKKCRAVKKYKN